MHTIVSPAQPESGWALPLTNGPFSSLLCTYRSHIKCQSPTLSHSCRRIDWLIMSISVTFIMSALTPFTLLLALVLPHGCLGQGTVFTPHFNDIMNHYSNIHTKSIPRTKWYDLVLQASAQLFEGWTHPCLGKGKELSFFNTDDEFISVDDSTRRHLYIRTELKS